MEYNIFMMADSRTAVRPFVELTKQLEKKINVKVYMLCAGEGVEYRRILKESSVEAESITFIELVKNENRQKKSKEKCENIENKAKHSLLYKGWRKVFKVSRTVKLMVDIKDIVKKYKKEDKMRKRVEILFHQYTPDVVILYSDCSMGYSAHVISVAAKNNIPRIVAPITSPGNWESYIRTGGWCHRKNRTECFSIVEKYVAKKYPKSCVAIDDIIAFKYEPQEIVIYGIMGMMPENPWVLGMGNITLFATASQENYKRVISAEGETDGRKACMTRTIEETGIIMQLQEREEIREGLIRKYEITTRQIVCIALSAYAHSSFPIDYDMERKNYIKIITAISEIWGTVLVSLHPQMKKQDYLYLNDIKGCKVVDKPLYKIVPACDVFIGADMSSTRDMVERLSIHKIYFSHEAFLKGISEADMLNLQERARLIKALGKTTVNYSINELPDFVDLVVKELAI